MDRVALVALSLVVVSACPGAEQLAPVKGCSDDADCAQGEVCADSLCVGGDGEPVVRSPCTVESEGADCGVGGYCDGSGYCAELPACAAGGECDDGLVCNDATGGCVRAPECDDCCTPGSCDDGRFCNGVEACSVASGLCLPGDPPCSGAAPICDEARKVCLCSNDGDCGAPETCNDGVCGCLKQCAGKGCGDDGCGGSCGACSGDEVCNAQGQCECVPDCAGKQCGSDGCDGTCGVCASTAECSGGQCVCVPDCIGRQCGDDGCGGSCGGCGGALVCAPNGQCGCVPSCGGRVCGDDGCGGSCGTCDTGACGADGQCGCAPSCAGKECGDDGCGGSCGGCGLHQACNASGLCLNTGDVCDVLTDSLTLDEYQTRNGFLTMGFDAEYEWDGRPYRYLDNYPLTAPAGTTVEIDVVSTEIDPQLFVYNVAGGGCTEVAFDDDSGGSFDASLSITLGSGVYQAVATSFEQLKEGAYTIKTSTMLCGLVVSETVYDRCRARVTANSCSNNPCVDYGNSPDFCCVTASCRSGYGSGDELKIFSSASICNP